MLRPIGTAIVKGLLRPWAVSVIFGVVVLSAAPLQAQTIAGALEQAWSRHPAASGLDARESQAQAGLDLAARATPGPAALSMSALSDRFNRDRGSQKWEVEFGVPLWLPGQQAAREAQARRAIDGLAATRDELRLQIAAEIREQWWALALARDSRDQAIRRATTARELESVVERRYREGDLSRMDANLARSERLAAEAELSERQTAVHRAEAAYRSLTGVDAPGTLVGERVAAEAAAPGAHPLIVAAEAAVQLARASLLVSQKTVREAPRLSMRIERDRGDAVEPFSNAVGLKMTIPFASEALVRQQAYGALADVVRAEAELARLRLRLPVEVERSRAELSALDERLALARRRGEFAADNLQLGERAFALGESDLTTLLRVRASALEAEQQMSRLQLQRDAAASRLNQALGVLP